MRKIIFIVNIILLFLLSSCSNSNTIKEAQIKTDSIVTNANKLEVNAKSTYELLGELSIELPEDLQEISEERIKILYSIENRPDYAFCTPDMGVNLCYSITKIPLKLSDLQEYLDKTANVFDKKFGQENVSQSQMDTINGIPFAILEFYSPTNEGRVYNLMFTTSYTDKMTVISFNCLESKMADWEEDVSEIFSSITLKK